MNRYSGKSYSAFTFVELMVVVAIFSLLAAIAFPIFASSKKASLVTEDYQKLHQCQLACALHSNDHQGEGGLPFGMPDIETVIYKMKAGSLRRNVQYQQERLRSPSRF